MDDLETAWNGIVDDVAHHRFVFVRDGGLSELVYRREGTRLVLVHTEVPPRLRRRGIAGRLVRAAAEQAAAEGLTVVPWCRFARTWLQDHPDAAVTVQIDWTPRPA